MQLSAQWRGRDAAPRGLVDRKYANGVLRLRNDRRRPKVSSPLFCVRGFRMLIISRQASASAAGALGPRRIHRDGREQNAAARRRAPLPPSENWRSSLDAQPTLNEDIRNQFCRNVCPPRPHCPNMSRMPYRLLQILAEELGLNRWSKQSKGAICLRTPSWDQTNFAFSTRHLTGPGNFSNRNIMPARRQ
jgi:hypothetical protein